MKYTTAKFLPHCYHLAAVALGCGHGIDNDLVCVGIPDFPDWFDGSSKESGDALRGEYPDGITLHAYCMECQKRCWFVTPFENTVDVPNWTKRIISAQIPACPHGWRSWDISPYMETLSNKEVFEDPRIMANHSFLHKVYCRRCRRVYQVLLNYDESIHHTISCTLQAWY